jgi:hypothetical protein
VTFDETRARVVDRLEQADRGDRGWFLITRVHLSPDRIQDIASYLYRLGAGSPTVLSQDDYRALGRAADVRTADPGLTLRRHHLLAMEKPLQLLQRTDGRRWAEVQLTGLGVQLANDPNTPAVLEVALHQIIFCREPWYTPSRVEEYTEFEIAPYPTTIRVLENCDHWIDRDEYDLFLSRIRNEAEVEWAIEGIRGFRELNGDQRQLLLGEVRDRIPGDKAYQNWRDVSLHVFSLFDLGVSVVRKGSRLLLTAGVVVTGVGPGENQVEPLAAGAPHEAVRAITLQVPTPVATNELAVPPPEPAFNPGTKAEILVGKFLQADGWAVSYYTNRRGFGFDLYAVRGDSAILVEVKSANGQLGSITLTRYEYEAAIQYGPNYILAIVESLETEPSIRLIQDPAASMTIEERPSVTYSINRTEWQATPEFTLD